MALKRKKTVLELMAAEDHWMRNGKPSRRYRYKSMTIEQENDRMSADGSGVCAVMMTIRVVYDGLLPKLKNGDVKRPDDVGVCRYGMQKHLEQSPLVKSAWYGSYTAHHRKETNESFVIFNILVYLKRAWRP